MPTREEIKAKALSEWPKEPPFDFTLLLPLEGTEDGSIKEPHNFKVLTKYEEEKKLIHFTVTFSVKDGSKVPKDAD